MNGYFGQGYFGLYGAGLGAVTPAPVTITLTVPAPSIVFGQTISPSPVTIPLVVRPVSIAALQTKTPSPVTIPLSVPAPSAINNFSLTPDPVTVYLTVPTVGSVASTEFVQLASGISGLFIYDINFAPVTGLAGPIIPDEWSTSRYQNRVGTWRAVIPIDNQTVSGVPIHSQIRRGWHVCIIQENNYPQHDTLNEYLLYMGVVLQRDYQEEDGSARLVLAGTFRSQHLVDRPVHGTKDYTDTTVTAIADFLVNGSTYIGSPGGIQTPLAPATIESASFANLTRFAALVKLAELARYSIRESWGYDILEMVPTWGPPDSGVRFISVENADPGLDDAGEDGFGLISSRPTIRYDGTAILNRITAIGTDNPDGELTLNESDQTSPYTVGSAVGEDGNTYYFIEDTESQGEYGIVDHKLIATNVRNPSDDATTRLKSANVLYATAVDALIRNRSERFYFECEIANGSNIWVLPGDMVTVDYVGYVEGESGNLVWADVNKRMIVVERHDNSDPSGVRKVRFALAAPELEFEIPGLPDAIVLPPLPPPSLPPLPPFPPMPPLLPPEGLDPDLPIEDPPFETPGGGGPITGGSGLPYGLIRIKQLDSPGEVWGVLQYWSGATWENLEEALEISDPGAGALWLEPP